MYSEEEIKEILIDKLIKCGMGNIDTRKKVLDEFERIAPDKKLFIVHADIESDNDAVRRIVDKCLAFSEEGVEQLTYAVLKVVGGTDNWKDLDEFVRTSISKSIVSYTVRKKVVEEAQVIEWPEDILIKAYTESVPENWKRLNFYGAPDKLMEMLKNTAEVGILPKRVPLLEFVERLALYASDQGQQAVSDRLRSWIKFTGVALKLSSDQWESVYNRARQKKAPRTEAQKAPYLLIELYTDDALPEVNTCKSNHKYGVRAWLLDNKYKPIKTLTEEYNKQQITERQTIEEIEASFVELLDRCLDEEDAQSLINIDNLVIEFLVPDELLKHEFDCWQIRTEDGDIKLGIQYRVVVRSAKRFRDVRQILYRSALKNKWSHWQEHESRKASATIACICSTEQCRLEHISSTSGSSYAVLFCCRKECHTHNGLKATLRGSSIICLALAHAPYCITDASGGQHANTFPLFQTLRWTGMPIALWARNGVNTELLTSSLSGFSLHSLISLLDTVTQWRRNAEIRGEEQAIGKNLSLLWDDPTRPPPDLTAKNYKIPIPSK